jgi:hypothetical protein
MNFEIKKGPGGQAGHEMYVCLCGSKIMIDEDCVAEHLKRCPRRDEMRAPHRPKV